MLVLPCLLACGKISKDTNPEKMERAVKRYIKNNDAEKGLRTYIERIETISYEQIPEDKKMESEDVYICQMLLVAKSAYEGSGRVYNINDTMTCYFDKEIRFLRWNKKDN